MTHGEGMRFLNALNDISYRGRIGHMDVRFVELGEAELIIKHFIKIQYRGKRSKINGKL